MVARQQQYIKIHWPLASPLILKMNNFLTITFWLYCLEHKLPMAEVLSVSLEKNAGALDYQVTSFGLKFKGNYYMSVATNCYIET